jgi:anaphase-promoting complex subunit 13
LTIEIVDNDWRKDKLPNEDIQLPVEMLPDPENNEDGVAFSLNQEEKWMDLGRLTDDQLNSSNL